MTSALYFLPLATTAVRAGANVLQEVVSGASAAGSSFADMLAGKTEEEEDDDKKIDGANGSNHPSALLALIDQIQNGIQAKLQSLGLALDSELTLSIDDNGQVQIAGDSDSAAMLEQIINSDPALQSKMGALKRAAKASGEADRLEAKLGYERGSVQLQLEEPVAEEPRVAM